MSEVTKTCRDINELSPVAQKAIRLFLKECEKEGLNVLITETYRSQERQDYLFKQGREAPYLNKAEVTWVTESKHTSRNAWDLCENKPGEGYKDDNFFKKCGDVAKRLDITWGGDWKQKDKPHFEVKENWKEPKIMEEYMVEKRDFKVDGTVIKLNAINHKDKNYVELAELRKVGLNIDYDKINKTPIINTKN